jgi:hypothetical protein
MACPFLLSASARRPLLPGDQGEGAPLFADAIELRSAAHAVHGPGGVLPLAAAASAAAAGCPFFAALARAKAAVAPVGALAALWRAGGAESGVAAAPTTSRLARRLATAPFARISFPLYGQGASPATPVRRVAVRACVHSVGTLTAFRAHRSPENLPPLPPAPRPPRPPRRRRRTPQLRCARAHRAAGFVLGISEV